MFDDFISSVRALYQSEQFIPLHKPRFQGREKEYLLDVIDSTYVSSVGPYVNQFEESIANYTGVKHAIATVNGTAALHIALILAGVKAGEEVITQALTFVATCNAIHYCGAEPIFVDVDPNTLGMSATALENFLQNHTEQRENGVYNKRSGKKIAACVPMHTFGHPCEMLAIMCSCQQRQIPVVEDAAEALGSLYQGLYCGTQGAMGVLSFNGNKIITTGGGGMILTNDTDLAQQAKHLSTTAKLPHAWAFDHDRVGYNYRMPNLNAALGLAQLEQLPLYIEKKRAIARYYAQNADNMGLHVIVEPQGCQSNYWLNTVVLRDLQERNDFLESTNQAGVMTRPLWTLMSQLPIYQHCQHDDLSVSTHLAERLVNIPSSVTD